MEFLNVISVTRAEEIIMQSFSNFVPKSEKVKVFDSLGRVASTNVVSTEDIPDFNRSTMDGYAVIASNTFGASESIPSILKVVYEAKMGEAVDVCLRDGEACYVPTGAMLPSGANSVVMIEYTEKIDCENIAIYKAVPPNSYVIHKGDDVSNGAVMISRGTVINELEIGVLVAAGICEIEVFKPLNVSVISTGDEIVDVSEEMQAGKIRDVNGYVIASMLKKKNCVIANKKIICDEYSSIKQAMEDCLATSDLVIISGGSSVGVKDYTHEIISSLPNSEVIVHGLSVKPGKPTIVANCGGKAVFGLPGHPVSAAIVHRLIVDFYLNFVFGTSEPSPIYAVISENLHSSAGKLTCQMVKLSYFEDEVFAEPIYGQSGLITLLSKADGFIKISEFSEGITKGEKVLVFPIV